MDKKLKKLRYSFYGSLLGCIGSLVSFLHDVWKYYYLRDHGRVFGLELNYFWFEIFVLFCIMSICFFSLHKYHRDGL